MPCLRCSWSHWLRCSCSALQRDRCRALGAATRLALPCESRKVGGRHSLVSHAPRRRRRARGGVAGGRANTSKKTADTCANPKQRKCHARACNASSYMPFLTLLYWALSQHYGNTTVTLRVRQSTGRESERSRAEVSAGRGTARTGLGSGRTKADRVSDATSGSNLLSESHLEGAVQFFSGHF